MPGCSGKVFPGCNNMYLLSQYSKDNQTTEKNTEFVSPTSRTFLRGHIALKGNITSSYTVSWEGSPSVRVSRPTAPGRSEGQGCCPQGDRSSGPQAVSG